MNFRKNYWSCTQVADWIRGQKKPPSGTFENWELWEKESSDKHPIRYWIAEEGLDHLQDICLWIPDRLSDVRYYINNRWVSQTHGMYAHSLEKGQWHEFDRRLLHCMFDELINFVEIECAWMEVVFSEENTTKYQVPWWRRSPINLRAWRCPEAGIAHLEWAASLKFDGSWFEKDRPEYGQPTPQAITAKETLELYRWWKETRPARPDPYIVSGWNEYCEKRRQLKISMADESEEDRAESERAVKETDRIEDEYDREDSEMMIRLIKIRQGLWT